MPNEEYPTAGPPSRGKGNHENTLKHAATGLDWRQYATDRNKRQQAQQAPVPRNKQITTYDIGLDPTAAPVGTEPIRNYSFYSTANINREPTRPLTRKPPSRRPRDYPGACTAAPVHSTPVEMPLKSLMTTWKTEFRCGH